MITRVIIGATTLILTLRKDLELDGVVRVSKLALLGPAPDKLARRIDRPAGLLHNLHASAQSIIGELAPVRRAGVVDRHEPVGTVPLEGARQAIVDQTSI